MKEIVIISGKGGTGKTSLTTAFAQLFGDNAVIADCDVDAANLHIISEADFGYTEDFYSGYLASIDKDKCTECGKCIEVCHFDAISDDFIVDDISCEGCGYCAHVCPEVAISMPDSFTGRVYQSKTRFNNTLVHAQLEIAGENSGKLVSEVKTRAREIASKQKSELILIDGSPGIGCTVIASLSGASLALIVSEPSISGYNDLVRLYELISRLGIATAILINKSDLNKTYHDKTVSFSKENGITIVGEVPYNNAFTEALSQRKTILEYDQDELSETVKKSWEKIKTIIT
jgi:MinD superfamily P-loop ATPase